MSETQKPEASEPDVNRALGQLVKRSRQRLGLSQATLVERLTANGIKWSEVTLSTVENGTRGVRFDELQGLASAIQMKASGLLNASMFDTIVLEMGTQKEALEGLIGEAQDAIEHSQSRELLAASFTASVEQSRSFATSLTPRLCVSFLLHPHDLWDQINYSASRPSTFDFLALLDALNAPPDIRSSIEEVSTDAFRGLIEVADHLEELLPNIKFGQEGTVGSPVIWEVTGG